MRKLLLFVVLCACAASADRLFFNADGKFKISQFTDMHYYLTSTDEKTDVVQEAVLKAETPDLVVITGDAMSGTSIFTTKGANSEWKKSTDKISQLGYRWALILGNHDDDGPVSREDLVAMDINTTGSLTQVGPADIFGVTNYYLPVYATQEPVANEVPAAILWLLAVQDKNCEGTWGQGCVTYAQVKWFVQSSQDLTAKYGLSHPPFSMMFFHIPTPEFVDLWNTETVYGNKSEKICCPKVNTGLYDAAYEQGVSAMFVGHDHKNDFCGAFAAKPSLALCYGRKTGYGYYNPSPPMNHGARIIELTRDPSGTVSWDTWIREEDGLKVVQVAHPAEGSTQSSC